ncbi:MAG TPA: hypothetical protein VFL83_17650 [Anaeromyxobacter sp.]|nr:hypothetical protein [Anaeromyxobacter sp.]
MRISIPLAAALALLAGQARAETIDVSSTTMLQIGQQTRGGANPFDPQLETVAPAFEILSIAARDVRNPVLRDLSLFVSTWGSYELAEPRWDTGTPEAKLNGDLVTLYAQARMFGRRVTLRLGREMVSTGVARMIHLDGGELVALLPAGFRLQGYAGVPVTQRFGARTTLRSWSPVGGDLAYGGRVAFAYGLAGYPGRGLELGASANFVEDGGDPVRQEVGADFRLQPFRDLTLTGLAAYSVWEERASELLARASYSVTRRFRIEADARYYAPDLFLARNSILSVFSAEDRRDFGAAFTYELTRALEIGAGYHVIVEPGETEEEKDFVGSEAALQVEWAGGPTRLGLEVDYLDALENGYLAFRVFGRRDFGKFFGTADVLSHLFRESVNGEDFAVTGTVSAGMQLAKGLSVVIAGNAGVTPFLEQTFDVMAKLAYNSIYRAREVR